MPRSKLSLDGRWEFFVDREQQLTHERLDEAGQPREIEVPLPWQAQFEDLRDYSGVAWYRRRFEVPEMPSGTGNHFQPSYILHFGAVDYHATIWLNGQYIGEHEGGYLPFELVLDEAIRRDGPNELVVKVIDPSGEEEKFPDYPFVEIPHGKQSWYGPISGLWQSVYLEVRHTVHIKQLQITPDVANERAEVAVHLNRPDGEKFRLTLKLTTPDGETTYHNEVIEAAEAHHTCRVPVPEPMLWDTHHPHLYQMEATLITERDHDTRLDTVRSTFGMRTITTSEDGHLVLNGRVLYLRGALDQDYYPHNIYTPFTDEQLDDQFAKARQMGLNLLRTHIKITDPRYYDAADRAGILIWSELPNWENLTEKAKVRAHETMVGMVERDWNHPSIIIWTIINEGWGVDLATNADHRQWLLDTYHELKAIDPHRLTVGNSPCFATFHIVTDIEDFHNYYAIPDHHEQWREWIRAFAGRPPWTFAHNYESIDVWREYLRDPWNPTPRTPAPEVLRRGNEPMVVSEFGNWGLPDVQKLYDCYGGEEPWWFESGLEWADGAAYPHGIEKRFKIYHLDKVFPTLSDLTAASQRMQFTALKYQIEQIRRYPDIVGYVITEFTDVHWEANGLLDICRNPKAYHNIMHQVNSADAMVPDTDRIVYWEGERCEVSLALSHFSPANLQPCRVEWHLDIRPEITGSFENIHAQPAHLSRIGTIVFDVPDLDQSRRARLEFRLFDSNGEQVSANHQELYLFPQSLAAPATAKIWAPDLEETLRSLGYQVAGSPEEADIAATATMTDELRWYLQTGGRVLWLAEHSDSKQTFLGHFGIAQRSGRSWQGDWASNFNWIRQDKMFSDIPTGGVVDFAFASLIPDHVIVGVSPRDHAANVHAGLFVGWLHHTVALVAERPFGQGRLLTSTFHLREHLVTNPVARVMFNDMVNYLATRPVEASAATSEEALPGTV